jgi:hypothetical protein
MSDRRLSIIGAGKFGTTIARAAVAAGYDVVLAGSRPPEEIELMIEILVPGARAVTVDHAVAHAERVVLAVPTFRFRELASERFAGKVLIDTMNYWELTDGIVADFVEAPARTSEVVQRHFASARVVKSLNQLGYHQFEDERRPRGTPGRIAMAAAGDDRAAVGSVLSLIDDLGFDPVDAGPLSAGRALGPGGPAFGVVATRDQLVGLLGLEPAMA